jgi:bifunctional UDP-N-acetylglucosamine pyrophosphorylase/glucosamine-1-phosphate N-acetyltransferase
MPDLAIIVLAAGRGTRMKSTLPKVLHELAGRSMLGHVLRSCEALHPRRIVVVVGPDMAAVEREAAPHDVAVQPEPRGTGDAVRSALPALGEIAGDVLVVYGDTPLLLPATMVSLIEERRRSGAAVAVLGMDLAPPNGYGRLILGPDGDLDAIVEAEEATPEQQAVRLCNAGIMAIDGTMLGALLQRLVPSAAKREFYLTDIVAIARGLGRVARAVEAPADELAGVNSRVDQAAAEAIVQTRLRARAMAEGATLTDPASVFLSADTVIGRDVVIGPHVVIGPGVAIEDSVEIRSFCHIEGSLIRSGAVIGPFARLRPGTEIGAHAHVGNFVELKNAVLGPGAKANHLSYLGDAEIGARSNIGAGTITCNYDGFSKFRTVIGTDVFIGSNAALVAPLTIGSGAMIAAGSVVTRDVAADATAIARGEQVEKPGHARRFRERRRAAGKG